MSDDETRIVEVDQLDCLYSPRDWAFARDRRDEIEAHWRRITGDKPKVFNGRVLLLHRGEVRRAADGAQVFHGAYLETDYSAFLAWRDFDRADPSMRNCFAMAALLTSDNAFLLGEMNAHTANPGRIYFAAGTPDPNDIINGKVDLDASALRELGEETGLQPHDVSCAPGWTLVIAGPRIACMKLARSKETAAALQDRIHAALAREAEPELARVHIYRKAGDVDPALMPDFMRAFLDYAPGKLI